MFLKRLIVVNWGNLPNGELDMGPINLLSGGNGSGKTTAGDALQTVMTAAHENLFHYNPGQEETTQRGRGGKRVRTLASYVLGCDDGSYARLEPSDGYLAAVFHPTQGETATPFTALIGIRARLDRNSNRTQAELIDTRFLILPTVELQLSDVQPRDSQGAYVVALDQISDQLIRRFGKRAVEDYGNQKKAYLRRLYGALRGKTDSVAEREAMAAARAFSRFMAYKPVSSINQFVADEILERKELGEAIRNVSQQLKTIHGLERDAQQLKDSVQRLQQAQTHVQIYIDNALQLLLLDYQTACVSRHRLQQAYLQHKQEQQRLRELEQHNQTEIELTQQRLTQTHEQKVQLEAQRLGIPALQQRDELQRRKQQEEQKAAQLGRQLLLQDNEWQTQQPALEALQRALADAEIVADMRNTNVIALRQAINEALQTGQRQPLQLAALLQQSLDQSVAPLEQHFDQIRLLQQRHNTVCSLILHSDAQTDSVRDQWVAQHERHRQNYQRTDQQWKQLQDEITRLQNKQIRYPAFVEQALSWLRQKLPQAEVRVLCDYVEVSDERWQAAIEGYLGGARFNLLVDAEHEADAIRCLRQMPSREQKARIIQGEKALRDAERVNLSPDSVVHVMAFSHAIARAFFIAQYGAVLRVPDAETLRKTARAITVDGMGSGGYTLFRCDMADSDLVFGASARVRALAAKQRDAEQLQQERHSANTRMQNSSRLLEAVKRLQALNIADAVAELLATQRELSTVDRLLSQIDQTAFQSLDQTLEQLRLEEKQWQNRNATLQREAGALQTKLERLQTQLNEFAAQQDVAQRECDVAEARLRAGHQHWPEFDIELRLNYVDQEAQNSHSEQLKSEHEQAQRLSQSSRNALDRELYEYNRLCRPGDAIALLNFDSDNEATFRHICGLHGELDRLLNVLRNNVLIERHTQLQQLKHSFNNVFVTSFCHTIHNALRDGERQIELLNKELEHHYFGADRERFRFASEWLPEYRDYARFFDEVFKHPSLGEGTTLFEADLSEASATMRDALMDMLLAEDEQKALRDLERIADYRNYRRYEIYKEVEGKPPIPLSEYGTGSGGQLETPAYIIRAAAITSAFRFNEGQNHLRMVLVDEAFSKMDEARSREVIHYLTSALGLQLIFIMPTSKCGPFMDLISNEFVFAKVPSTRPYGELRTRVLLDRKLCNRERIQAMWAQHKRTVYQQAELDFLDALV